jgi:hypothetical protein
MTQLGDDIQIMRCRTRRHLQNSLAIIAWLAQLLLPMAHAATMANPQLGASAWCGPTSPALQAKLADLPEDIRRILFKATPQSAHVQDCMQCCVSSGGVTAPPREITVVLRAAGLELVPPPIAGPAQRSFSAPPPARGPPTLS